MNDTTNDDVLIRTNASGIATLTLNRPEARNALYWVDGGAADRD